MAAAQVKLPVPLLAEVDGTLTTALPEVVFTGPEQVVPPTVQLNDWAVHVVGGGGAQVLPAA